MFPGLLEENTPVLLPVSYTEVQKQLPLSPNLRDDKRIQISPIQVIFNVRPL